MSLAAATPIEVTAAAVAKLHALISAEDNADLRLRVYIVGGGCSGYQYGFAFDAETRSDDVVVEKSCDGLAQAGADPVGVVVDPISLTLLQGATIDYIESLQGSHFVVINPNAKTTCGCGSSFSV